MYEDDYLDAAYEDRTELPDYDERDYVDYDADYERDQDYLLEQQELEDFEQADEYFNHYDYNDYE